MKLTYKELAETILRWKPEQQEQDVTIWMETTDEYMPMERMGTIREDEDVLDKGHKFIVIDA